jgi:Amt family ammonium transporter
MELLQIHLDYVWIVVAAMLVFFMQAGFTALEAGLIRSKNSINVAIKNLADLLISSLLFTATGFAVMFGPTLGGWAGTGPFFLAGMESDPWNYAFLLFQIMFAGTAATIVSGAVAERMKFGAYLAGTFWMGLIIYPVFGHWAWGSLWQGNQEGWLEKLGFMDFAGSTVVHSVGGWVALAAALVVGPRIGKYEGDGTVNKFRPSNAVFASLGVFVLWFGWFGFNAGSTLHADTHIALIALNTHLAASAGGLAAMLTSWIVERKVHVENILNGVLGGLVAVTAGVNVFGVDGAILAGGVGGLLVIPSIRFIEERLKIDDAVGAVSVHAVCGAWGTVAVGMFGKEEMLAAGNRLEQIGVQVLGAGTAFLWAFFLGLLVYGGMKKLWAIRPNEMEEEAGLNVSEHGASIAMIETIEAMNEIAAAKGDLTKTLKVEAGEDTEVLHHTFNKLLQSLNGLVDAVKREAGEVHRFSGQLLEVNGQLNESADIQMQTVKGTYEEFRVVSQWLDKEIQAEDEVIGTIQGSFAGMEHIGVEIISIKQEMNRILIGIQDVTSLNEQVMERMGSFQKQLEEISAFSQESQLVIDTINEVSEQINLLSLNAGIEAARAGEHGKGFAVVAKEIKRLAGESKTSASRIRDMITHTVAAINHGNQEMDEFVCEFNQLNEELKEMPAYLQKVEVKTENIHEMMTQFIFRLQTVREETSQMQKGRFVQQERFVHMLSRLEQVYEQMKGNHDLTKNMAEEIEEMGRKSRLLQQTVERFRTRALELL